MAHIHFQSATKIWFHSFSVLDCNLQGSCLCPTPFLYQNLTHQSPTGFLLIIPVSSSGENPQDFKQKCLRLTMPAINFDPYSYCPNVQMIEETSQKLIGQFKLPEQDWGPTFPVLGAANYHNLGAILHDRTPSNLLWQSVIIRLIEMCNEQVEGFKTLCTTQHISSCTVHVFSLSLFLSARPSIHVSVVGIERSISHV